MKANGIVLKEGKEKAIKNRHHWIFSGAIGSFPSFSDGDILPVYSHNGEILGSAYFNKKAKIIGRMIAFGSMDPYDALKQSIDHALQLRACHFNDSTTNAYRLINGEGDYLPGFVVDKYHDTLVIQISTMGMEKLRNYLVEYLQQKIKPKVIYEKSLLPSRKEEGLKDFQGSLMGNPNDDIEILENGIKFLVSIKAGQKTGFFLDHREMRQMVKELSYDKTVLNCFAYTGGFSLYALQGKAKRVDSVDISQDAIHRAQQQFELNQHNSQAHGFYVEDVFDFLRQKTLNYDLVILDPPAFAKKQKDIIPACRGYKDINRIALQKIPPGSLLLTSSCSYYVNEELFQKVLFQASIEAKRSVKIIGKHRLSMDHPINLCHPESNYLKSFLLYVD